MAAECRLLRFVSDIVVVSLVVQLQWLQSNYVKIVQVALGLGLSPAPRNTVSTKPESLDLHPKG